MLPVAAASDRLAGLGFERIHTLHGSTFKDCSTVLVAPTRGMIHHRVVAAWQSLIAPMNQKRAIMFAIGDEVGIAYNRLVSHILAHPECGRWKYIMTIEADNLVPPDAHKRLLETMESGMYDGASGLYFTKGDINMPMAYGDPHHFETTGELEFRPRDTAACIAAGQVMPVNGIAMRCARWRNLIANSPMNRRCGHSRRRANALARRNC